MHAKFQVCSSGQFLNQFRTNKQKNHWILIYSKNDKIDSILFQPTHSLKTSNIYHHFSLKYHLKLSSFTTFSSNHLYQKEYSVPLCELQVDGKEQNVKSTDPPLPDSLYTLATSRSAQTVDLKPILLQVSLRSLAECLFIHFVFTPPCS